MSPHFSYNPIISLSPNRQGHESADPAFQLCKGSPDDAFEYLAEVLSNDACIDGTTIHTETGDEIGRFYSPFFTALVWDEILPFASTFAPNGLARAVSFLLDLQSVGGGWSFFPDGRGYPPDADDTAVVATFLSHCGALRDPQSIANLFDENRRPDGRSFVWLKTNFEARRNSAVDDVVDINVLGFYGSVYPLIEFPASSLNKAGWRAVPCNSIFYDDAAVCYWFASRLARSQAGVLQDVVANIRETIHKQANVINTTRHSLLASCLVKPDFYGMWSDANRPRQAAEIGSWLFRHGSKPLGYSCHALELAAFLRNLYDLGAWHPMHGLIRGI